MPSNRDACEVLGLKNINESSSQREYIEREDYMSQDDAKVVIESYNEIKSAEEIFLESNSCINMINTISRNIKRDMNDIRHEYKVRESLKCLMVNEGAISLEDASSIMRNIYISEGNILNDGKSLFNRVRASVVKFCDMIIKASRNAGIWMMNKLKIFGNWMKNKYNEIRGSKNNGSDDSNGSSGGATYEMLLEKYNGDSSDLNDVYNEICGMIPPGVYILRSNMTTILSDMLEEYFTISGRLQTYLKQLIFKDSMDEAHEEIRRMINEETNRDPVKYLTDKDSENISIYDFLVQYREFFTPETLTTISTNIKNRVVKIKTTMDELKDMVQNNIKNGGFEYTQEELSNIDTAVDSILRFEQLYMRHYTFMDNYIDRRIVKIVGGLIENG